MGSSASSVKGEERSEQDGFFSLLRCCGSTEEVNNDHNASIPVRDSKSEALQPQRRSEMQVQPIDADRMKQCNASGQWLASTIRDTPEQQSDTACPDDEPAVRPQKSLKRKRFTVSIRRQRKVQQPSATEDPTTWRLSLPASGRMSPLPDFSAYELEEFDEAAEEQTAEPVDNHRLTSEQLRQKEEWPLPQIPSSGDNDGVTGVQNSKRSSRHLSGNASDFHELLVPTPAPACSPSGSHFTRLRAHTEPFRFHKRKRAPTSRSEKQHVDDAIRELQTIVDEKRGAASSASNSPAIKKESVNPLQRTRSGGHVPAIAPSMKVRVRTELLNDIGSAFSKPLSSGDANDDEGYLRLPDEAADVPAAPPDNLRHLESENASKIYKHLSGLRLYASRSSNRSQHDVYSPSAGTFYSCQSHRTGERLDQELMANRASIASVASTNSTISTSDFPTAPTTPPLSSRPSTRTVRSVSLARSNTSGSASSKHSLEELSPREPLPVDAAVKVKGHESPCATVEDDEVAPHMYAK